MVLSSDRAEGLCNYRSVLVPVDMSPDQLELISQLLASVWQERKRAHAKHGATSMEQARPLDPWRALILAEEAIECGTALNDDRHGSLGLEQTVPSVPTSRPVVQDELDTELIQTMAMAYTWWANRRGDQLPPV